jgi:hypothetical protein
MPIQLPEECRPDHILNGPDRDIDNAPERLPEPSHVISEFNNVSPAVPENLARAVLVELTGPLTLPPPPPPPAGVAQVPSPLQKVELVADVPEFRLATGRLPEALAIGIDALSHLRSIESAVTRSPTEAPSPKATPVVDSCALTIVSTKPDKAVALTISRTPPLTIVRLHVTPDPIAGRPVMLTSVMDVAILVIAPFKALSKLLL